MELKRALGNAMRIARAASRKSQEDFVGVANRTYISGIERGIKQPTLNKLDMMARHMDLHPLTLVSLIYLQADEVSDADDLLALVKRELEQISQSNTTL